MRSFSYTPRAGFREEFLLHSSRAAFNGHSEEFFSHTFHAGLVRILSYSCTPLHARVSYDTHASQSLIL